MSVGMFSDGATHECHEYSLVALAKKTFTRAQLFKTNDVVS